MEERVFFFRGVSGEVEREETFRDENDGGEKKTFKKNSNPYRVDQQPVLAAVLVEPRGGPEARGPGADDEDADLEVFERGRERERERERGGGGEVRRSRSRKKSSERSMAHENALLLTFSFSSVSLSLSRLEENQLAFSEKS